jgi:hypothetical protein
MTMHEILDDRYGSHEWTEFKDRWWRQFPEHEFRVFCWCCAGVEGRAGGLQLHHVSYDNVGRNLELYNVVPVCRRCHEEIHQLKKDLDDRARRRRGPSCDLIYATECIRHRYRRDHRNTWFCCPAR